MWSNLFLQSMAKPECFVQPIKEKDFSWLLYKVAKWTVYIAMWRFYTKANLRVCLCDVLILNGAFWLVKKLVLNEHFFLLRPSCLRTSGLALWQRDADISNLRFIKYLNINQWFFFFFSMVYTICRKFCNIWLNWITFFFFTHFSKRSRPILQWNLSII